MEEKRKVKCQKCRKEFRFIGSVMNLYCVHCGAKISSPGEEPTTGIITVEAREKTTGAGATQGARTGTGIGTAPQTGLPFLTQRPSQSSQPGQPAQPAARKVVSLDQLLSTVVRPDAAVGQEEEYVEQFQCPVCETVVDASTIKCPACGVKFGEETVETTRISDKHCSICNTPLDNIDAFTCAVCSQKFCTSCPSPRIPPEKTALDAKVDYKYKLKHQSVWTGDATKFIENLPNPLCPNCYGAEHEKTLLRLKSRVKHWEIDIRRDADVKILNEQFPKSVTVEKKKRVLTAQDFLKMLVRE